MTKRFAESAAWVGARASNALRRPLSILTTGIVLAVIVLVGLIIVPRRATRQATAVAARIPDRPDSLPAARVKAQAFARVALADSQLALGRREAAAAAIPIPVPIDTLPAWLRPRRDSLLALISALSGLIARAENVPLASSYRALGESRFLAGSPAVRPMLDSLAALERERESFGAVAGADPLYIALTARANAIGRNIVVLGRAQRAALRAELRQYLPPPPPPRPVVSVDTLRVMVERADATRYVVAAEAVLARMRLRNREIDELERRARQLREVGASVPAMIAAALVVGLALGFAFMLLLEMRRPRIADVREAEHAAGVRALAVVRPRISMPERRRRRTDIAVPKVLDPFAEHYRQLYLHLTSRDEPISAVTITGVEPEIAAVVALNIGAFDAREARTALVLDTDPLTSGVARALDIPAEPGLSDVLSTEMSWSETLVYIPVERDQVLEVVPSGRRAGQPSTERAGRVRSELERISERYDLIVFVASVMQAKQDPTTVILSRDVVVCARIGHTRLYALRSAVERIRSAGMTVHGLVLWAAEPVRLPPVRRATAAIRGPRTEQFAARS